MTHYDFLSELCAFYRHTRAVSKRHAYRLIDGKLSLLREYSFIVSKGGARFLVKWGPARSRQHQWCCLNEAAQTLVKVWADLDEPIRPCGLIDYAEYLELKSSKQTVQQVVQATTQPASQTK